MVRLACNDEEIKAAQRLRYRVFVEELGAEIENREKGLDVDHYGPYCLHLLAIDENKNKVIGTYRLLTLAGAKAVGGWYSACEFDLNPLSSLLGQALEIGRAFNVVRDNFFNGEIRPTLLYGVWKHFFSRWRYFSKFSVSSLGRRGKLG